MRCTSTPYRDARLSCNKARWQGRARGILGLALVAIFVAGAGSDSRAGTNDNAPLVESIRAAPGLLIGSTTAVERVAHGGWVATVAVERVLHRRDKSTAKPKRIEVAWEEAAPSLPSRFDVGSRLLIAIEPLDSASIWKQRVPELKRRAALYSIAARGNAYLERPSGEELSILEHYLSLSQDARRGDAGVVYLVALAARSQPRLALSAIEQLGRLRNFTKNLGDDTARELCDALMRDQSTDRPLAGTASGDVGKAVLALIERHRPKVLRAILQARIKRLSPNTPAVLYAALGALDGEIPDSVALELLATGSVDHRLAAARWANGSKARERLRYLLVRDPEPSVRAAAVSRLLQLESSEALPDAIRSFEDPAAEVRLAATRSIAAMDPEAAIPELQYVVESGTQEGARGAVLTLSLMGVKAHEVLLEISDNHPDKSIRALAGIAIGRPIGHVH